MADFNYDTASIVLMETKGISVNGDVFRCPLDWIVKEAEERIRSRFVLQGGRIEENGIPLKETDVIGNAIGSLAFVGGLCTVQQGRFTVL